MPVALSVRRRLALVIVRQFNWRLSGCIHPLNPPGVAAVQRRCDEGSPRVQFAGSVWILFVRVLIG